MGWCDFRWDRKSQGDISFFLPLPRISGSRESHIVSSPQRGPHSDKWQPPAKSLGGELRSGVFSFSSSFKACSPVHSLIAALSETPNGPTKLLRDLCHLEPGDKKSRQTRNQGELLQLDLAHLQDPKINIAQ